MGARHLRAGRGGHRPGARQPHDLPARQPDPGRGLRRARRRGRSSEVAVGAGFTVTRIPEELEFAPGLLEFLEEADVVPGRAGTITAASPDGTTTVEIDGRHIGIGAFASQRILVTT